jgi:hypothetical protein
MLAKPVLPRRPPVGILLLVALMLSMIIFSRLNDYVQDNVSKAPPPPTKVLDAETERRLANIQADVYEVRQQVHRLQLIYGPDAPMCENLVDSTEYQRCHELRKQWIDDADNNRRYNAIEASRLQKR